MDERRMMEPPVRAVIMWRAQAWETRKEPVRLMSRRLRNMVASYDSALILELVCIGEHWELERCSDTLAVDGLTYSTTPAEFITMSTEPKSKVILATTSAITFASRTSTL